MSHAVPGHHEAGEPAAPRDGDPLDRRDDGLAGPASCLGQGEGHWAFAGTNGGGGVIEVESHEELDAIMARYPFAPFSSIEILALSDIDQSLANAKAFIQEMMAGMAKP